MSLLVGATLFFLAAALLLYVVLAGADFGGGILELCGNRATRRLQRPVIARAMAPVWEANHIWLILAVVILFVAFPAVYVGLTTSLHLPVLAILLGIVGRGCAFTFRHYDTFVQQVHAHYSRVFAASSLWTAFFLGVVSGACAAGHIDPHATTYRGLYLDPWCNLTCLLYGLFACSLFTFLAAAYLLGETRDAALQKHFVRRAGQSGAAVATCGALLFLWGDQQGGSLGQLFFAMPPCRAAFAAALLVALPLGHCLRTGRIGATRLLGATLVGLILAGYFALQFPLALAYADGGGLDFYRSAAPPATLRALLFALGCGTLLIVPALAFLLKVFKWDALPQGD